MTDLISRADAIEAVCREICDTSREKCETMADGNCGIIQRIDSLPSADAVQGEWKIDEYGIYHCPFCHAINNTVYKSFCPNCGARMKGGAE